MINIRLSLIFLLFPAFLSQTANSTNSTNATIIQCDPSCKNCSGPSFFNCMSCNDGFVLVKNPLKKISACLTECPNQNYYVEGNECKKCMERCNLCEDSASCFFCDEAYLYNEKTKKCELNCPKHTFPNYVTNTCETCDVSCLNCTSGARKDCVGCAVSTSFFSHDYKEVILINGSRICSQQCDDFGSTFNTKKGPVICCEKGSFYNESLQKCTYCDESCETCYSWDGCWTCSPDYLRFEGKCVKECPKSYYLEPSWKSCQKCSKSCIECTKEECLKCENGTYLDIGICRVNPCKNSNLYDDKLQTCVEKCSEGTFQEGPYCRKCLPNCKICKGRLDDDDCLELIIPNNPNDPVVIPTNGDDENQSENTENSNREKNHVNPTFPAKNNGTTTVDQGSGLIYTTFFLNIFITFMIIT